MYAETGSGIILQLKWHSVERIPLPKPLMLQNLWILWNLWN